MSSSKAEEPVNEQAVANKFAAMRSELNQIYSKITELEMDVSEHSLVINAIQPLDPSRRCFRMIGGVLVERTIKEVLPAVQRNKEGIEEAGLVNKEARGEFMWSCQEKMYYETIVQEADYNFISFFSPDGLSFC